MDSYRLYYSNYCFFCQKVLMALRGREHPIELANTAQGDHRAELIQGGGKGQVPCLRIEKHEGSIEWMYESDDILDYIRQAGLLA
jgi:glutathione S-transferase